MSDPIGMNTAATTLRAGWAARDVLRHAGLALLYALLWIAAGLGSGAFWFLPAGLRFLVLWLLPNARWPAFAIADMLAIVVLLPMGPGTDTWTGFVLTIVAPWCGCALAVALARPGRLYVAPESPERMGAMIAGMLLAAGLNAAMLGARDLVEGRIGLDQSALQAFDYLVRDYVAMLIVVPIGLQVLGRAGAQRDRELVRELGLIFVLLAIFWLWLLLKTAASLFVAMLALVPVMLMAFRHGWRGASWTLALTGLGFLLVNLRDDALLPADVSKLFLAVVGSVALLLGAAIESMRRLNFALIERGRQDKEANARLASQAADLRELSRRLVRAREDEQGRLAHELHDELGQSVAALGTRLGLLARKVDDPELVAGLHAQRELVQRIQESIREVLQGLRPAMLDRFGLEASLREGPIQRLLESAAIRFEARTAGPIESIGQDTGSAIYRICQEAATNCVRHAQARSFRIQLDAAPAWAGSVEVHLRIEDDGRGFDLAAIEAGSQGSGLRGIRDRVMALAGDYRCESGPEGTRHLVWFVDHGARGRREPRSF
jgi:glucose-6-phosphate-specific signal transduction histidine kinase